MNKFFGLLGLAYKSGNVVTGEENILNNIRQGRVKLVVVARDASNNTKKLYRDKCKFYHVNCVEYGTSTQISQAIGKINRIAVGICDKGFAEGLLAKITK